MLDGEGERDAPRLLFFDLFFGFLAWCRYQSWRVGQAALPASFSRSPAIINGQYTTPRRKCRPFIVNCFILSSTRYLSTAEN